MKQPITALILTLNEEAAIADCIRSVSFCDQVIVVDSGSLDGTASIATALGAEVVHFEWDGAYPKKKQWAMELENVRNDWVLHLDADERVSDELAEEIGSLIRTGHRAFEIPLLYWFGGQCLQYGHHVRKRALLHRSYARFPEVGDLHIPGITEVEGHYQPMVNGSVGASIAKLEHRDPDPIATWFERHLRYATWETALLQNSEVRSSVRSARSRQGRIFDRVPFKPLAFFIYSFVLRGGFRDGRAGFDYAFALAWYYWLIDLQTRENQRR